MEIIPRAKCVCPSCIEEINLGDCDIVSSSGRVLRKAKKWSIYNVYIESLDGPLYNREQAQRRCPRCGYLLPKNIENVRSVSLSVVGGLYSGKSHYIASLIQQIRFKWSKTASGSIIVTPLTQDVENDFMARYLDPLFGSNMSLTATAQAARSDPHNPQMLVDRPLIYKVEISPPNSRLSSVFNLMIYDTSGEDFRRIDRLVQLARFAFNSSAFIFVADPLTMDTVYGDLLPALQALVPPYARPIQGRRTPSDEILTGVIDSFKRHHRQPDQARLAGIPVAVMVSKADIFSKGVNSPYIPTYYGFAQNYYPSYDTAVDLSDIDAMHEEVIRLLVHYQQVNLLNTASRLSDVKFFATSATGTPPDSSGNFSSVNPWRCLDPLLWILYKLRFIDKF